MNVPLNEFNDEQKLWYGYMVASATKADGSVDPAEIDFLVKALHFLSQAQKDKIPSRRFSQIPGQATPSRYSCHCDRARE